MHLSKGSIANLPKMKIKEKVEKLPETPGVYIFWEKDNPIYIGKAKNLKNRLASYFGKLLSLKTRQMVNLSDSISYIKVESELESLLLEATLIRKNQPRYNSSAKDDKHPLYIKITKEHYPRVITARKAELSDSQISFGPFPSSSSVYSVLKMLRRIFPYSDHRPSSRPCIYSDLGLCKPCPSEIERISDTKTRISLRKKYLKNIRRIKSTLSGKFAMVKKALAKEMEALSGDQNFEEAGLLRDQIASLDYITQPIIPGENFLENPNLREDLRTKELKNLKKILIENCKRKNSSAIKIENLRRTECFDVAHLGGVATAASMVTFVNGEPEKSLYRHFRIRQKKGADDIASMAELVKRRIYNFEKWGIPDLIIVDGGKTQVSVFSKALSQYRIPTVGLAKKPARIVIPNAYGGFETITVPRGPALNLLQRISDEAHRFARQYHHHLLKKAIMGV